jgi:hypothetical protein
MKHVWRHFLIDSFFRYMFMTLDKTREEFLKHMDEYGDHYTKYIDDDSMKEVIKKQHFKK